MPSIDGGNQMSEEYSGHRFADKPQGSTAHYGVTQEQVDAANADTERWIDLAVKLEHQDGKCRLLFQGGDYLVLPFPIREDHFILPLGVELFGQGYGHDVRGLRINGELVYYNIPQPKEEPSLSPSDAEDDGEDYTESPNGNSKRRIKSEPTGLGKLDLQVGSSYSDGNKTVVIVAKLKYGIKDMYHFVGHTGGAYTNTGVGYNTPSLIMPWHMAENVYCEENVRGYTLLQKHGGDWLGAAREWIQCNAINGERVIWGSHEQLQLRGLTVYELEHLAARIAAAGINQYAREHYMLRTLKKAREGE